MVNPKQIGLGGGLVGLSDVAGLADDRGDVDDPLHDQAEIADGIS